MNKLLLFLFVLSILSCGKDKEENEDGDTFTCEVTAKAHNGCCSYHDGFTECASGSFMYNQDGKLLCDDGETSPTCTW